MHSLLITFFNRDLPLTETKLRTKRWNSNLRAIYQAGSNFYFPDEIIDVFWHVLSCENGWTDELINRTNDRIRIQSVIFFWGKKIKSDLILSLLFFFFFFFHDKKSRTNNSWNILKQKIERENFEKENARGEGKRNGKIHGSRFFSERSPVIVFRPRSKRQRQYGKVGTNSPVFSPPVKGGGRKGASIKGATQRKQRRPR